METRQDNTVYTFSFPSNHLFGLSILKNTRKKAIYEPYIAIVSLSPSEMDSSSPTGRTYVTNRSINLKFSIMELLELSFALHSAAVGNLSQIGQYTKFSKSEGVEKTVTVFEQANQQGESGRGPKRVVVVMFRANENKYAITLSPQSAYALATYISEVAKLVIKLSFNNKQESISPQSQSDNDQSLPKTPFLGQSSPFDSDIPF